MLPSLPAYPDDYQLTTREAGQIAGKHRRTVVAWIKAGHLSSRKLPGKRGQYRILFGDLKQLLEREYVPTGEA